MVNGEKPHQYSVGMILAREDSYPKKEKEMEHNKILATLDGSEKKGPMVQMGVKDFSHQKEGYAYYKKSLECEPTVWQDEVGDY